MLDDREIILDDKSVVIFDEAGMADLDTFYRLSKHLCSRSQGQFCGEKEQLQPVGAANGFKYLNENFTTIPLTSINRQKKQKTKLM